MCLTYLPSVGLATPISLSIHGWPNRSDFHNAAGRVSQRMSQESNLSLIWAASRKCRRVCRKERRNDS